MAQFDVHRNPDGPGYILNCQTDLLDNLETRLVVPLVATGITPPAMPRLHPTFVVDGVPCVMATQYAASVPTTLLGPPVASLRSQSYTITNALDLLITGI